MAQPELHALRAEMDVLNQELCALLQRRARLALRIGRHKRAAGMPIADPARETTMLAAISRTHDDGFDAESLRSIFACVFRESRRLLEDDGCDPARP